MVGTTLSHYKILEKLGEGGMGEVYRAEDTSLKREIAIKVLPEEFTKDPQRLARFEREAQLLASLNHPNIAAVHSFEHSEDIHFLVLELVEGETLAERVAKGPLPVEEALEVCRQIAEGVEAAHEKGVIHRDLKPANVKITPEGKVKILDFGLAKAFAEEIPVTDISQSPTLTEEMTRAGVILGTAAYMSPEQAKGKPVDKRADIFAFGAVLYELLTGKRAFEAETIAETIAAVLKSEPDWKKLPSDTPWGIRTLMRRCLHKEVNRRLQHVGDVRIEIEEALTQPTTVPPIVVARAAEPARWRRAILWGLTSLFLIAITGISVWNLRPPTPQPITRLVMALPPTERLSGLGLDPVVALSPDGTHLVYVAVDGGSEQLYLRAMDQLETKPIVGTEGATHPFFSPDGQWVGFFAEGKLKKVSTSGGAPLILCDATNPRGASWGANDTIVFAPTSSSGLSQVSAAGGTPQVLTTLDSTKDERSHRWPELLSGGKAVLFTAAIGSVTSALGQIVVQSLETGERRVLIQGGSYPHYVPTGHLVYARAGTMMAVPFDLVRLEVTGAPVPIQSVMQSARGAAQFSFSGVGSLVYLPGGIGEAERTLVWVDRNGAAQPLVATPRPYSQPRLSPDGQRLAVEIAGTKRDIWVYDISRETLTRLTFEGIQNQSPTWTPDGKRVTFTLNRARSFNLSWRLADGSGVEERLTTSEHFLSPSSWSPDGQLLAFSEVHPTTGWDVWVLPLEGERKPRPFLITQFNENEPMFSPDGRWLAYASDDSGRREVYLQPFPGPGRKWQISTEGGREPHWARNGRELFYRNQSGDQMMAVDITTEPTFSAGKPRLLFEERYETRGNRDGANYDVTPDGQRFIMVKAEQELALTQINVVLNWFEELKRLVPTN